MSFLVHLTPAEAVPHLEERGRRLEAEIERTSDGLKVASTFVERIHLVESEYLLAMLGAELGWVRKLADEIRGGAFSWDLDRILEDIRPQVQAAGRAETKARRATTTAGREEE